VVKNQWCARHGQFFRVFMIKNPPVVLQPMSLLPCIKIKYNFLINLMNCRVKQGKNLYFSSKYARPKNCLSGALRWQCEATMFSSSSTVSRGRTQMSSCRSSSKMIWVRRPSVISIWNSLLFVLMQSCNQNKSYIYTIELITYLKWKIYTWCSFNAQKFYRKNSKHKIICNFFILMLIIGKFQL